MLTALISTLKFFAKTAPLVASSYIFLTYASKKGYLAKPMRFLANKLSRLKLNPVAFTSFVLSFFNVTVSYTFLSRAWREGRIKDREVIAVSLLNSFPSVFSHLYSFYIPFVIPILGYLGIIYTGIRLSIAFVKTLLGYAFIEKYEGETYQITSKDVEVSVDVVKILIVMFLTYLLVEVLYDLGVVTAITKLLSFLPIEPNALAISVVAVFNLRSAVVFTAGLIEKGLSYRWALVGLILGNVISFSVRSARHSLPLYLSLFGRFGFKIVLVNSLLTLILDLVVVLLLLV